MKNEVLITIEGEEWSKALDTAFKKLQKTAKVDGFRTGKVPRDMFEKKYGKETLYREAMENLIDSAYEKALAQNKEEIVAKPVLDIEKVDENGVTYKFTLISRPEVTLGEYKNIGVKKEKVEVTDEEAEHELGHLQQKYVDIVSVDREVKAGDIAVINFEGFKDGVPFEGGKAENYSLEIGSHSFIEGFEDAIIGMKKGEEKDINLSFPENYHVEDLKGKPVVFKVKVNEVKEKKLPELNEDFYLDLGMEGVNSKETLMAELKEQIKVRKEHDIENKYVEELLNKAASNMKVEIPEEMVNDELDRIMEQYSNMLAMQGVRLEDFYRMTGSNEEQMREQMKDEAVNRIKSRLLLEEIAKKENLEVSDKMVDEELESLCTKYNMKEEELLKEYGGRGMIEYDIKMRKSLEILKENN